MGLEPHALTEMVARYMRRHFECGPRRTLVLAIRAGIRGGLRAAAPSRASHATGNHRAAAANLMTIGNFPRRHADALSYRLGARHGINRCPCETAPRLYGRFPAYMLCRWKRILRKSAIFSILGAARLGYYVEAAISELWPGVAMLVRFAAAALFHRSRRAFMPAAPPASHGQWAKAGGVRGRDLAFAIV